MKLWLLAAREGLPEGDNPWSPWNDACIGFIVRAETETDARILAQMQSGNESSGVWLGQIVANTKTPWLEPKYSTCEVLAAEGIPGVIVKEVRSF